ERHWSAALPAKNYFQPARSMIFSASALFCAKTRALSWSSLKVPSDFSSAESSTPATTGYSELPSAKYFWACGDTRYSRNFPATALLGAWRATAPPLMLTWVPRLGWLGHTTPTLLAT